MQLQRYANVNGQVGRTNNEKQICNAFDNLKLIHFITQTSTLISVCRKRTRAHDLRENQRILLIKKSGIDIALMTFHWPQEQVG